MDTPPIIPLGPAGTPAPHPREPAVTEALGREHGLSAAEFARIHDILGRPPTFTELGVFSVMWSEHCSYKSSRLLLRGLPTSGPRVLQGPGENAGVIDASMPPVAAAGPAATAGAPAGAGVDDLAIAFKMESHNHPSFIEPYQGAATGVGGILRDVFTMGARPIACANHLRFGRPDPPRTRQLIHGVVAGIAGYGNAFGVPTVAGDVAFEPCYDGNILVNVMAVGVCHKDRIFLGSASGVGNPVLYLGQKTGRDGIHGATMASAEFGAAAEDKRPTVQVGDPFTEKLLLEACLQLMTRPGLIVGIQDMGAAGLTSSSIEMAARAGSGIDLDLDQVPRRETAMTPYEILLSESQERMLLVVARGREEEAIALCRAWDIDVAVIGQVTDSGRARIRARWPGEDSPRLFADLPIPPLAEGLRYERPRARPAYLDEVAAVDLLALPAVDANEALVRLLGSPALASKEWIYRQYDHQVRNATVVRPGQGDAAVLRLLPLESAERPGVAEFRRGVALTGGCNARLCYLDPYEGALLAVSEAYRNLCAVGAEPAAVTDCLNFASPERPEVMWQLAECVRGLSDACAALETPVVSGNVSLYNETSPGPGQPPGAGAIYPTPMVGMVGLVRDVTRAVGMGFPGDGYLVALLGFEDGKGEMGGSEYLKIVHGLVAGRVPRADLGRERITGACLLALIEAGLCASAHDVSEGGILVALAESCLLGARKPHGTGCAVVLPQPRAVGAGGAARLSQQLFHEGPARYIIAVPADQQAQARGVAREHGVPLWPLGRTGGRELVVRAAESGAAGPGSPAAGAPGADYKEVVRVPLETLAAAYHGGLRAVVD